MQRPGGVFKGGERGSVWFGPLDLVRMGESYFALCPPDHTVFTLNNSLS